jgi:hypothetical protein
MVQLGGSTMMRPMQVRMGGWRPVALVASLVFVAACGANQASSTPVGGGSQDTREFCPEANLRTPNGGPVRLTGRWQGDDFGTFYMTQRESCLHWLGMSPAVAEYSAGDWWTQVFVGQIASDFTITGEWADVPYAFDIEDENPPSEELTLGIDFFEDEGGTEWPTLHLVEVRGESGYGTFNWVPEEAFAPRTAFVGTYGYTNCPWLEVAGTRYELAMWQYETAANGQLLGEGSQILARPGDTLHVEGQIWPTTIPDACVPGVLLGWNVEVGP